MCLFLLVGQLQTLGFQTFTEGHGTQEATSRMEPALIWHQSSDASLALQL